MSAGVKSPAPRPLWLEISPDLLAFAAGLAIAWHLQWQTRDLVWSLWLASLVVGYGIIVWTIIGPVWLRVREAAGNGASLRAQAGITALYLVGGLFLLAFFTMHFGGFHAVHSVFLSLFFPVDPETRGNLPGLEMYATVVRDYWPFVLVAFVAERAAFRPLREMAPPAPAANSVKAADVNRRLAEGGGKSPDMTAAYKNVIRLHLLIFFFAFASFMKLENFAVYAVVYAVYFFPWRIFRRRKAAAVAAMSAGVGR